MTSRKSQWVFGVIASATMAGCASTPSGVAGCRARGGSGPGEPPGPARSDDEAAHRLGVAARGGPVRDPHRMSPRTSHPPSGPLLPDGMGMDTTFRPG